MCFAFDARPPAPPADLAPIAGGAGAELLELSSSDGTPFSAALAQAPDSGGSGVVILPDVRGLYPFYSELAERFAQAGHDAIAIDYFGRSAGLGPRGEDFEYMPHVQHLKVPQVQADAAAAIDALRERTGVAQVATVGFCLGGLQSFLAGADLEGLAAVVGFYGVLDGSRFGIPGPLERAGDMRCPLLGLFGGRQSARTLHFLSAHLLVAFLVVHVVMVILSGFWNNMRSMVTGWMVIDSRLHWSVAPGGSGNIRCGGQRNCTTTSLVRSFSPLPDRKKNGTLRQRQLFTDNCTAA